jgi:hypothetical protein
MKKFGIIALAALLVVAFTVPASALENVFGGYWRTRFVTQQNFSGKDEVAGAGQDMSRVDTRTRLYYTAIINENLKLVNKFEIDNVWGDLAGGDIGADAVNIEVKNSYADFTMGPVNYKVGIQPLVLARSFLVDVDLSGLVMTYKGEGFSLPFFWVKGYEGGTGKDMNDEDVDIYGLAPTFNLGEGITLQPMLVWMTTNDYSTYDAARTFLGTIADTEVDIWYWGLNADAKFGPLSLFFTGIVETGDIEIPGAAADVDISAYLLNLGAAYDMGMFDIHGEFFYASGDDNPADNDSEAFWVPEDLDSYYWAEIMGFGIMDQQASNNSPNDDVSNIWALNLGTNIKPMEKLTVKFDLWYAEYAEERAANIDETLGTEADLVVTYELLEGLNVDVVGAYLWADDCTYKQGTAAQVAAGQADGTASDENPYELGVRLSLSF